MALQRQEAPTGGRRDLISAILDARALVLRGEDGGGAHRCRVRRRTDAHDLDAGELDAREDAKGEPHGTDKG
jgi:hypothetical protein